MSEQKQPQTRTINQQVDLLDQIIESTKDIGISYSATGLEANSFTGLCTLAKLIFDSGAAPKSMDSSKKVLIAIAYGQTIGLNIWQSMKAIYIVNGMPSVWGRTVLALCRNNPNWDESGFDEYWEIKGERQDSHPVKFDDDTITAVCQTLRKGAAKPMIRKFSIADAKRAGLWGNNNKLYGPYPQRLLPARALGYCLDDNFGDSLKGIQIRETFDEEVDGNRQNGTQTLNEKVTRKRSHEQSPTTRELQEGFKEGQELSNARHWVKTSYGALPLALQTAMTLRSASEYGHKWMTFDDIDKIEDVEWLKMTAANLEDAAKAVQA